MTFPDTFLNTSDSDDKRGTAEVTKTVEMIQNNTVALHKWVPDGYKFVVAYVHGLQSHAGWSWELAMDIAESGGAFFVMDRRGSGVSSGDRYKFPPANQIIDDYVTFFCKTFEQAEERPVIAVGHCLGGSVLAATLSSNPEYLTRFRNIYFASAWLGKMHTTIPEIGIEEIRKSETSEIWDAGLRAEDFSENSYYQDFIRNDEFAIRGLASSTRKNILELEDIYLQSDELSAIEASFITSHDDPVIDVESAVENFCSIFPNYGAIHFLNANRHYLPFTDARHAFVGQLISGVKDAR
jgi:putative hydrolase